MNLATLRKTEHLSKVWRWQQNEANHRTEQGSIPRYDMRYPRWSWSMVGLYS